MRTRFAAVPLAVLLGSASAYARTSVGVDPGADAHPISPNICGMNFPDAARIDAGGITVARCGGNGTTRYNYQIDATNTAADWYFENVPGCWDGAHGWCASPPPSAQEQARR